MPPKEGPGGSKLHIVIGLLFGVGEVFTSSRMLFGLVPQS